MSATPRTREEIEALCDATRKAYQEEFGEECLASRLTAPLADLMYQHKMKFIATRLGHLPSVDLISFFNVFTESDDGLRGAIDRAFEGADCPPTGRNIVKRKPGRPRKA